MPALPFPRCMIFANAGECSTASASAPILSFNDAARRWRKKPSAAACATASGKFSTVASGIAASAGGSSLRYVITNRPGTAAEVFDFYQHRGECENRIAELKNGFAADRLSCQRF